MAKDKLTQYDSTASNNTDVGGISVAEGMLPSGVNNALREQMSHLADFASGTSGVDVLKLQDDTDTNSIKLQAPASVTATTTFTLPDGDGTADQVLKTDGSGQLGFADRHANPSLIINGAMQVAARGTQTNQTSAYTACDRFQFVVVGAAVITSSQDTTVPSGQGFSNSLKLDVTTADSSLAASDFAFLRHKIEAQNLQHLNYGTSSAKSLTLSFWVRSSKTGTHIAELRHDDATYFNSQAYTISSADVWQKVTLTYDGYVTTAINNDNGAGINVNWWLAAGSDYSGGTLSANTWQNTPANRAVGQVNVMDSTSNDFYITGVKLEVGSTATDFEHRSYGDELARCQRYCFAQARYGDGSVGENAAGSTRIHCARYSSAGSFVTYQFPVMMREKPDLTYTATGGASSANYSNAGHVHLFDGDDVDWLIYDLIAEAEL